MFEKAYQKINCCGKLVTKNGAYMLLYPKPLMPIWEDQAYFRFLVVPFVDDHQTKFSYPRHLIISEFPEIEYYNNKQILVEAREWQHAEIVDESIDLSFVPEQPELPEWFLELEKIDG